MLKRQADAHRAGGGGHDPVVVVVVRGVDRQVRVSLVGGSECAGGGKGIVLLELVAGAAARAFRLIDRERVVRVVAPS